jgi:hypothetical protein
MFHADSGTLPHEKQVVWHDVSLVLIKS